MIVPPSPVLLLTNHLLVGGAEVHVVTFAKWLAAQGVEVIVAATPGALVASLPEAVHFEPVPLTDVRLGLPVAVSRIRRLVRRFQPQVVVANSLVTAWVARLATAQVRWNRRIPVVQIAHGWRPEQYARVGQLSRISDRVIAVSHQVEEALRGHGLPDDKIRVVLNGVDLTPFGPREASQRAAARLAFGAGPDDVVVTNVGRFAPPKAQDLIIELAAAMRDSHPRIRFAIIGYGELETALREQMVRAGVGDRVTLLVQRSDVPELLMGSDIYLHCSRWEGMPLAPMEAMAAGLPLVVTDAGGMGMLVEDNGFVEAVDDRVGLAASLGRLADDPGLRAQMGRASRALAESRFSKERMCEGLAEVLRAEVERRG